MSPRWGREPSGGGGEREQTFLPNSPKKFMKLKEFGCLGGGRASLTPLSDPPLVLITTQMLMQGIGSDPFSAFVFVSPLIQC